MPDFGIPSVSLLIRSIALFASIPLGFDALSTLTRIGLAALAALALADTAGVPEPISCAGLCGDMVLGFLLALPCALIFHAAEWFGEAFDTMRGQTIGSVMDPLHVSSTVTSQLCSAAVWAYVLASGILVQLVGGLAQSMHLFPKAEIVFSRNATVGQALLIFLGQMLSAMMGACLPFAFIFVALELAFGIAAKLLPGINLNSAAFLAKLCIGFTILAALANSDLTQALPILAQPALGNFVPTQ